MARPTLLTQELIEKAKTYLSTCVDTVQETDKGALAYVNVELPTLEGFALFLEIHKDTVQDWCKGDSDLAKEFSVLVKDILHEQGKRLINKGLGGLYQPKIAGMILSKHGYIEKTEQDVKQTHYVISREDSVVSAPQEPETDSK